MRRAGSVFHRARIDLNNRLGVLVIRVLNASVGGEEAHHLRCFAHVEECIVLAILTHVVGNWLAIIAILDHCEIANNQREQIYRVRNIVSPVMRLRLSMISYAKKIPIGDRQKLCGHRHDNFGRGAIIRSIVARKPVTMVAWLSKRPGLHRARWIFCSGLYEMESSTWMCIICYSNRKLFPELIGTIQRYA